MKVLTPPLAMITWEDATLIDSMGAWADNEPPKYDAKLFIQVGFVLYDGRKG